MASGVQANPITPRPTKSLPANHFRIIAIRRERRARNEFTSRSIFEAQDSIIIFPDDQDSPSGFHIFYLLSGAVFNRRYGADDQFTFNN
jgi:hypothetical protein